MPITVGVARTKFLAKVASAVAKPDGLLLVEPAGELAFLHPLPVERLWGVGVKTADKLHARGINTVGEVAALSEIALVGMLGRASGRHLHALAHNRDPRRVVVGRRRRSIGGQRAIGRRGQPKAPEFLDEVLVGLIDRITRRLRAARRVARTVILRLRFDDFTRATRSLTIAQATAESRALLGAARELLEAAMPIDPRARLHARRPVADQPRGRRRRAARVRRSTACARWRSTRRSTRCARSSARRAITRGVLRRARLRDRDAAAPERLRTDPDRNSA